MTDRRDHPMDRPTRLASHVGDALQAAPEYEDGDKIVVMVYGDDGRAGIGLFGYTDDHAAIADIFVHLAAIFEANGQTLSIVPLTKRGRG